MFQFANATCVFTRCSRGFFGTVVFLIATSPFGHAADIVDVEDMVNPASFGGTIVSVSADGTTVVGMIYGSPGNRQGFHWKVNTGAKLIDLALPFYAPEVRGVSADGNLVFAQAFQPVGTTYRIGIWESNTSEIRYTDYGNRSNNIVRIVGNSWVGSILTPLFGNTNASINGSNLFTFSGGYRSISYGSFGVGECTDWATNNTRAYDPQRGQFASDLGVLPGGKNSRAYDKAVGVVVGESESTIGLRAFMLPVGSTTMQDLGVLPGKSTSSARLISADGYWIFGISDDTAFIWDSENGMRNLLQVLIDEGVNDIEGWSGLYTVDTVFGDSVNGYVLTGTGSNGRYIVRGLFAVPEPSTFALTIIAGFAILRSRKRARIRNLGEYSDFIKN